MAFLAPVFAAIGGLSAATVAGVGAAGLIGSKLIGGGGSQVQAQSAPMTPTRNDALERAAVADSLARRTGARGMRRTPVGGAEAATGAKTSLLGRS